MADIFISHTNEIAIITLNNIPNDTLYISKIFNFISKNNINVDMITKTFVYKSKISLIFSICENDIEKILNIIIEIKNFIPDLSSEITGDFTKVTLTNIYTKNKTELITLLFKAAAELDTNIFLIATADNEISALISSYNDQKFIEKIKSSQLI